MIGSVYGPTVQDWRHWPSSFKRLDSSIEGVSVPILDFSMNAAHSSPASERHNSLTNNLEKQMDTGTKIMTTKGLTATPDSHIIIPRLKPRS